LLRCESYSSKEDKTRNKEHDKEKVKYKNEIIEENINDDAYIHNEKRTIKKSKFFLEKIYNLKNKINNIFDQEIKQAEDYVYDQNKQSIQPINQPTKQSDQLNFKDKYNH
jgi:hypothetical protein